MLRIIFALLLAGCAYITYRIEQVEEDMVMWPAVLSLLFSVVVVTLVKIFC